MRTAEHERLEIVPLQQSSSRRPPEPLAAGVAAGAPAIASLQDALAFPEQTPLLGPVRRRALTKHTTSTSTSPSNCGQQRAAPSSASTRVSVRKKFPRGLARFRDRLQYLEDRLRLDVNALRQEISDLELQRSLVATRALTTRFDTTGSAAALAHEYFRIFRDGFLRIPDGDSLDVRAMRMLHASNNTSSSSRAVLPGPLRALQRQIAATSTQQSFLDARVDPHLAFHTHTGRDVLIEQWQRYTQSHAGLRMHLGTIDVAPAADALEGDVDSASAVVRTTGRLTAYITHDTLALIFPHVLEDAALTERLTGAAIEYPFSLELHVNASGAITAYNADVNFVTALSGVLGRLDAASAVLRDARISEYCMIGQLDADPSIERIRLAAGASSDRSDVSTRGCPTETPRASAPPLASAVCSPSAKARIQFLLS